jgi:hypothetical protein
MRDEPITVVIQRSLDALPKDSALIRPAEMRRRSRS